MLKLVHKIADSILGRIQRSPMYYKKYNNTAAPRVNLIYSRFARKCAEQYAKQNTGEALGASPVHTEGIQLLPKVFSEEKARSYSEKITALIDVNNSDIVEKDPSGLSIRIQHPMMNLGEDLLDVLRNPEVNRSLEQFFNGYFRIEWAMCYRSIPCDRPASSWLWHSDSYPPHTCKMFLYLTPANVDRGAMQIMNLEDTMAYRDAGYFGQNLDERYDNLEEFAKAKNIPYRPHHVDTQPGDATIFDMNFFHKAVAPKTQFRDVIQFFFLPSLIPWEDQLQQDGIEYLGKLGNVPKDPRIKRTTPATAGGMM